MESVLGESTRGLIPRSSSTRSFMLAPNNNRWKLREDCWQHHDLESASLLTMLIKKVNGLNDQTTKILDAIWIWTEAHSMRLKMAIDIERSVLDDKVVLKQRVVVNWVIKSKQCIECIREGTFELGV